MKELRLRNVHYGWLHWFLSGQASCSLDKQLLLNNKWLKSDHDEMLGQAGPHKKNDFLKSLRSREALDQAFEQLIDFSKKDPYGIYST
jgi:hypothetical protein